VCQSSDCNITSTLATFLIPQVSLKETNPFGTTYVKSQNCDHTGISVLQTPDGIATKPTSKAEILNSTFQSVFTVEDKTSLPALPDIHL